MKAVRYDAIVVGSGAAGGMAAYKLSKAGLKVLLLEAGPDKDPRRENFHHKMPFDLALRGAMSPQERDRYRLNKSANVYNKHVMMEDAEEPYSTPPGKPFTWVRSRVVGGKTLHWGRFSLRFSDLDFQAASRDGYGVDWPIRYAEIAPYYDFVERLIGVAGTREGLPQLPDGVFQPAVPLRCGEHQLRQGCEKLGLHLIPARVAVVTRPDFSRPKCHYCGYCGRLCCTGSMFSTRVSLIPMAAATGNLTLRPNSMVRVVLADKEGRARGVAFVDRLTRKEYEVAARVVVLGASCLESTRLLLNSRLGNSSGELGRNLCEHIMAAKISGFAPRLAGKMPAYAEDGHPGAGYIPQFQNVTAREKDFIRGYSFECSSGVSDYPGFAHGLEGFGAAFKKRVKELYPAMVTMETNGEVLARRENFVEIDPDGARDPYGIRTLRIHETFGENELRMVTHMNEKADPRTSVLDPFNRCHDVPNLLVVDGAAFPSATALEPTLTIMALAARACDHWVKQPG
ncbi:MAG: GMC family oxidoreductase [Acidobacteria bacterium]|nr:GMC family oxidoreductase [Acidobacteriota bacterium]